MSGDVSEKHDYEATDAGSHDCVYVCTKCGDEQIYYFHHKNVPFPIFCEPKSEIELDLQANMSHQKYLDS